MEALPVAVAELLPCLQIGGPHCQEHGSAKRKRCADQVAKAPALTFAFPKTIEKQKIIALLQLFLEIR